jgi:ubiquinone/menaquinone biosynthesis C-methylase UbiE
MGLYREQILPRLTDLALRGTETVQLRARAAAGLSGEVLEVGFGSGLTMAFYPPAVARVRAVDPSAVARKLAADKVAASAVPAGYVGVDAQALPLEDATVDHVVSILTLCTIPAAERALAEICRVLRPRGRFSFRGTRPVTTGDGSPVAAPAHPAPAPRLRRLPHQPANRPAGSPRRARADPAR